MKKADVWFKPFMLYTTTGWTEFGLMPAHWKGWLILLTALVLGGGACFLVHLGTIHHANMLMRVGYIALFLIVIAYMAVAGAKSSRP